MFSMSCYKTCLFRSKTFKSCFMKPKKLRKKQNHCIIGQLVLRMLPNSFIWRIFEECVSAWENENERLESQPTKGPQLEQAFGQANTPPHLLSSSALLYWYVWGSSETASNKASPCLQVICNWHKLASPAWTECFTRVKYCHVCVWMDCL